MTRAQRFAAAALERGGVPAARVAELVAAPGDPEVWTVAHRCADGAEVLTRGLTPPQARRLHDELAAEGAHVSIVVVESPTT